MSRKQNILMGALALSIAAGLMLPVDAQGRPPEGPRLRQHVATEAEALRLVNATVRKRGNAVTIKVVGTTRVVTANGIPDHTVGRFPNAGNPNPIRAQSYRFQMSAAPQRRGRADLRRGGLFGVAVNGVPFDPGAAEFWRGNPRSGWQYEALGGAVSLGLDGNYGHVQPTGAYHYHGLPVGLMQALGWQSGKASPLIGYAADGFPIYAVTAELNGEVRKMTSSYRLKSGSRPGGNAPSGRYDGAFVQDYTYVKGAGNLDECNGAFVTTAEYPAGTYAYFLTERFPVIPRCLMGQADSSFRHRR
ncbi:YHYH protein [Cognatishimia sp. SS12]|uniref:YHYH protein n=1 Tax=Cognatishimia sp. SS12 TaxID=2979465 RepID=UPI00232CFE20|nr:YHYH protein [Cognatishimia sp. SS12]MDC0738814.1 YHYH protein [Cognatishimia sp. SS12]